MGLLNTILNIVFPVYCISCGITGKNICLKCLSECPLAERECAPWIFPLFDYRHPPIKKAIWLIKYSGKKRLIAPLAEILYGKIVEELSDLQTMENFTSPLLIPIPISKRRRKERGFNQAEKICEEIVKIDEEKCLEIQKNILLKPIETEHQARIKDRSTRLKNLSGAFKVDHEKIIKGRNIILIDDVTTTGATLSLARKVLKQAGARKVVAFTLAH